MLNNEDLTQKTMSINNSADKKQTLAEINRTAKKRTDKVSGSLLRMVNFLCDSEQHRL